MENYLNNFQSFVSLEYLTELRVSTPINPIFPDFAITIFVFRAVISHVVILCFKCSRSLQLFVTSIVCFVVFISLFLLELMILGSSLEACFLLPLTPFLWRLSLCCKFVRYSPCSTSSRSPSWPFLMFEPVFALLEESDERVDTVENLRRG